MVAIAAHSPLLGGQFSGWLSTRQRMWSQLDSARCGPVLTAGRVDPGTDWACYALLAPVMLVHSPDPVAVTDYVPFADWADGFVRLGARAPRTADVDYHLTTLFPPVRPRGWLEIRYLDAVPDDLWPALVFTLVTLLDNPGAAALAAEAVAPVTDAWDTAARVGLADRRLYTAANRCLAIAAAHAPAPLHDAMTRLILMTLTSSTQPAPPRGFSASRIGQRGRSHRGLVVGLTAASIGLISGYDVASIGGTLLFITDAFGLTAPHQELVTAALAVGDIAGAMSAGALANAIGRKKSLMLVAASYAVFAVLGATSGSLSVLVLARLAAGVAIGVSYVVVPVFVAESAPARVRGGLLVSYQATNVIGMIVGYLTAYLLGGPQGWRWVLGLAAVPAVLVCVLLRRVGDTARWYLLKGRVGDARRALQRGQADVEAELAGIRKALEEERAGVSAVAEMVRQPYLRATVFVVVLGFLVQITGINAIISYGPLLFASMGLRGNFPLLVLPALVQVFALVAVLVSLVLVDRLGRRPVLLSGIATMVAADLVLVVAFAQGGNSGGGRPAAFGVFGVLLFVCGFNVGFGPLACVYAGESLPARLRSIGSAAMHTSNLAANAIVAALFLTLLNSLGGVATFTLFGVLAQIGFVFVHRHAPETKGSQLERIRHFWAEGDPDDRAGVAQARRHVALTG